jgi:hypothetical protein
LRWKASGPDPLPDVTAHAKKGATVIEQPLEEFFGPLQDSEDSQRLTALRKALESVASGLKVYRAGKVEVDVFIVAKSRSRDWIGLHTVSIET